VPATRAPQHGRYPAQTWLLPFHAHRSCRGERWIVGTIGDDVTSSIVAPNEAASFPGELNGTLEA
jgi:hypothetical protein